MRYAYQTLSGASPTFPLAAPAASIFPRYSARVFKETLAVVSLVLLAVAVVMLGTLVAPELFGARPANAACTTLEQASLLGPWCSAVI